MRKVLVRVTSAVVLYAGGVNAQVSGGAFGVRFSADNANMADDSASYWGVGGGTAGPASGGVGESASRDPARLEDKPHSGAGR